MPVTGDLFYATVGQHAFWGDSEIHIPDTGEISNESPSADLFTASIIITFPPFPGKIRNLGSTSAHISYIVRGRAEAALLSNVSYRDLAAAQIILMAAGGKIHRLDGSEFHLSDYLSGQRIEDDLIAAPAGAFESVRMYLKRMQND